MGKRKNKKRRRGYALRLPSGETKTPIKMTWGGKPKAKPNPEPEADAA